MHCFFSSSHLHIELFKSICVFFMQPVLPASNRYKTITGYSKTRVKRTRIQIGLMSVSIPEPLPIGNSRQICSHCHHRGHRNNNSNLVSCKNAMIIHITERKKKKSYLPKPNKLLKLWYKEERGLVDKLEQQVKSMQDFTTHNEHNFIEKLLCECKMLTPCTRLIE